MHQLPLRLDQRGEQPDAFALIGAEIGPFGYPAVLPQPLEDIAEQRLAGEPLGFQTPQAGEGGVEEFEPLIGTVNSDSGADPFEQDQLGGLKLTREDLRRRDRIVFDNAAARDIPTVCFLAGGYAAHVEDTVGIHADMIEGAFQTVRT